MEPEPWRSPRSLVAELATQEHHRAQILHRHREPQLRDQIATTGEWLDAEPPDEAPGDDDEGERHADRDEIAGSLLVPPQCQVPEPVAGTGDVANDGEPTATRRARPRPRWRRDA